MITVSIWVLHFLHKKYFRCSIDKMWPRLCDMVPTHIQHHVIWHRHIKPLTTDNPRWIICIKKMTQNIVLQYFLPSLVFQHTWLISIVVLLSFLHWCWFAAALMSESMTLVCASMKFVPPSHLLRQGGMLCPMCVVIHTVTYINILML